MKSLTSSYHFNMLMSHLGMSPPSSCFMVIPSHLTVTPTIPIFNPATPNPTFVQASTFNGKVLLRYRVRSLLPTPSTTSLLLAFVSTFKLVVFCFPRVNSGTVVVPNPVSSPPSPTLTSIFVSP